VTNHNNDDDTTSPFAGYGPYWNPGTEWGTPTPGPNGRLFPRGENTNPGPAGDEHVAEIIRKAIARDPVAQNVSGMTVAVDHGTVTLHGTASTAAGKTAAENAAWFAPGVHAVHNEIEIRERH